MASNPTFLKETSQRISSASSYHSLPPCRSIYICLTILARTDEVLIQKSAVEVHDVEDRSLAAIGTSLVSEQPKEATPDPVGRFVIISHHTTNDPPQTIKESSQSLPPPLMNSRGRAGGHQTIHRGDLDQVIRSMKDGKRRARPNRPLSKIFLDGGKSQS